MPAPFPLIKLGAVFLKQISKPIANFAKNQAKTHPFFRTYICMPPAQFYNWCEIKLKMWVLNLGKPVHIPILNEAMAIELGANLLGETIVFIMAASIVIMEYNRSANKEAAKEAARQGDISNLTYRVQELYMKIEQQDAQIREMHRTVVDLSASKKSTLGSILNLGTKSEPEDKPSGTPPMAPIIIPIDYKLELNTKQPQNLEYSQNVGLILNAVEMMERDILGSDDEFLRENGFVTNALWYIEHDVFRSSVRVSV